jgi:hypothetical protein
VQGLPTQRVLISAPHGGLVAEAAAYDRAFYGQIEQRQDSIDREVNGIIEATNALMRQLGITPGRGPNFKDDLSLKDLQDQIRNHVDPWELSAAVVRTIFLGDVHNRIEVGQSHGETPRVVISRLRKQIVDRHEAAHLLDEWDPRHRLYERFYAKLSTNYAQAMGDYLFHGEVDARLTELQYGPSLMALDRLLSSAQKPSNQNPSYGGDQQRSAATWVRDELAQLLIEGHPVLPESLGMQIVAGLNRSDQIKVQLFKLARDGNRASLNILIAAAQAQHNQDLGF